MGKIFLLIPLLWTNITLFAQTQPQLITEEKSYYTLTYYQVNDTKEGSYKEFYKQNGKTMTEGAYEKGLKEGVWKYFDLSGVLNKEETYKKNELNGPLTKYAQGIVIETGNYLHGEKDGVWRKFAPDGTLSEKYTYKKDVLLSRYAYFTDGKIKSEEVIPQNKNRTYTYKLYYNSGAKRIVSTLKNGEYIKSISYYENGQIDTVSEIVDGQLKVVRKYSTTGVSMKPDCGC
jgi:antitoxin component YwqK of YwqJK toxin-antitoxin module